MTISRRIEKDFWENNVLKKQLPEPDGSELCDSVIAEYCRNSKALSIPLAGFDERLGRRQELAGEIARLEAEKRKIEQELKMYLGEAELAENSSYRVSWKAVSSKRLDEKKLKEERPEIYAQYQRTVQSRRLTVKAA